MLLDTSGLACYFDEADPRHEDADSLFHAAPALLTHSYVLAEFVPLCNSRGLGRVRALVFAVDLVANRDVEVVWVDRSLHLSALTFLRSRPDKDYSLCDAVSFILMRRRGISDALTTDRHFDREGFVRLLRP